MSDLDVIKELEESFGIQLEQVDTIEFAGSNNYVMEEGYVVRLGIVDRPISSISPINKLSHLTQLDLINNLIYDLSPLAELNQLTQLVLRSNQFYDISPLKELDKLIYLDLSDNNISNLSALKGLNQLTLLNLRNNKINDISPLKELCQLIFLNISDNKLSVLSPITELNKLARLDLRNNQISNLSPLNRLNLLTQLDLRNNQISDLSPLKNLNQLTQLYLQSNQISNLYPLMGLNQLTQLYLRNNQISDISPLKELRQLYFLDLIDNKVSDLSPLMELTRLNRLALNSNRIKQLPPKIIKMNIKWDWEGGGLSLIDNPLEHPPVEIVLKGKGAVKKYFEELEKAKKPLNEVKVLLLGEGAAGKTSLVKRIRGMGFDKDELQTDGININGWNFNWQKKEIKVHLWDFGGQEIMHATHQFFLSKRSLYILVLDGRKDEKTEYWLKLIESVGGDSPVLVVINKIDQNPGFEVNQKTLRRKYKNIKGFFRLSCATNKGVDEFIPNLKEQLAGVEMLQTTWPVSWFNIKTALEKMKDDFISYDKYKEICEGENIRDSFGQGTLVEFLNDLGIILHFKDLELKDTNVLNPEWVTKGVYKIINSAELASWKGILEVNKLEGILKKGEGDRFNYPRGKCSYIAELMKKFELCFALGNGRILVPDLLKVEESEFDFDFENALRFQLDYDFLPRSVMPRFIVRMHNDIKGELRWRTGVVLEHKTFNATALVTVDHEEKKFYIFVMGERKRDYFSVIRHTIQEINDSFEKLEVAEKVPLPKHPEITLEYEELAGLERMGQENVYVGKLGTQYRVGRLLDGIEKPERRGQRELPVIQKETIIEKVQPIVVQPPKEKKKWYQTTWKVVAAIFGGLVAILSVIYTAIQIIESDTFKNLFK